MQLLHHSALAVGYGTALLGWLAAARRWPDLWPARPPQRFAHPWRELGWLLLACAAVLGIGQLYQHGWRLPRHGQLGWLWESLNQIAIFAPLPLLLAARRQPLATAWVRTDRVLPRLGIGVALALLALATFTLVRAGSDGWLTVLARMGRAQHIPVAVQVFLEDLAIAMLLVRLAAAMGRPAAVLLTAALFAAGHIPALLAGNAAPAELLGLVADFALGIAVVGVASRAADIWWLWCVHTAMDLTQFTAVTLPR